MSDPLSRHARQFLKFAIVGGTGTIVNLAVLKIFLTVWSGVAGSAPFAIEIVASALAFSVAVVNNFLLNRRWTFRSTGPLHIQFGKFFTVSVAGLGLNTLLFALFRGQAGLDVLLSQLLAILVVLPFNYLGSKLWSFR